MDFKKKYQAFKNRFGIADKQSNPIEEFKKFKIRIMNIIEDIDYYVSEEGIVDFCTRIGKQVHREYGGVSRAKNILNILIKETQDHEFFFLVEMLFTLPSKEDFESTRYMDKLYNKIKEVFDISDINASITYADRQVIVYPRGEQVLDHGLIEEVFEFLDASSQKHFISALKFYNENKPEAFIKSAESIRRSIEEFLRSKLKNTKGLEKKYQ